MPTQKYLFWLSLCEKKDSEVQVYTVGNWSKVNWTSSSANESTLFHRAILEMEVGPSCFWDTLATSVFLDLNPCAWLQTVAASLLPCRVRLGHELAHSSQSYPTLMESEQGTWNSGMLWVRRRPQLLVKYPQVQLQPRENICMRAVTAIITAIGLLTCAPVLWAPESPRWALLHAPQKPD